MKAVRSSMNDRIKSAIGAAALQGLFGYVLVTQLAVEMPVTAESALKIFEIMPKPPPVVEKVIPRRESSSKPKGDPSPPNLKARPVEIEAPPPVIPPSAPPPVIAAPKAGTGSDPSAGAADVPGPGTGSGGQGAGSGGGGDGDGGFTPPRWLRGRIKHSDYPPGLEESGIGQTITLQFTVTPDGRATGCTVLQSSGNPRLDDATCRAIERRYRYRPSRDAYGTAVPSTVVEDHTWRKDER